MRAAGRGESQSRQPAIGLTPREAFASGRLIALAPHRSTLEAAILLEGLRHESQTMLGNERRPSSLLRGRLEPSVAKTLPSAKGAPGEQNQTVERLVT